MMRLRRMAQGDTAINITTALAMWEAVHGRFHVKPVAAKPWDDVLRAREHALITISLGALLRSLPVANAAILLGSALVIYALGTSSWSNRRRLAVLFVILGAIIYGKFGVVRPSVGWARQGIEAFFILRCWDRRRITAKVVTTFLISGLWHLLLLRVLRWDVVAQVGLAFAIFRASVVVLAQLSHIWPCPRSVSTGPHPWVQRLCWDGKIALNFAFMAVIHGLFLNGLAGKTLGDTLAAYHVLCFGVQ